MRKLAAVVAFACLLIRPASGHRLDEYLQATILSLQPGTVEVTVRMVPGVAEAPAVIAGIDRDGDGVLSEAEQRAYIEQVMADLLVKEDGRSLTLREVNAAFPSMVQMQAGTGQIELDLVADLPSGPGKHELTFENHHRSSSSVYLVNALVPNDEHIRIATQKRNWNQSSYQLIFAQSALADAPFRRFDWSGFGAAFQLGVRHIAEGTDHLLFLLTLLLPAPLIAYAGQWRQPATVRHSLLQILRIVTAFTLGHSLTLALAGFGLVRLASRPVEVLIAVSILVSALHALRPIFPGREAAVAAFFGLVHGLAFASALTELGVSGWYRLVSILGFNLGIEAMQLVVVAVTLPSLLLLSRTSIYAPFRVCGGSVAAVASLGWIAERLLQRPNAIGSAVERAATHGKWIAVGLLAVSVSAWFVQRLRAIRSRGQPGPCGGDRRVVGHTITAATDG